MSSDTGIRELALGIDIGTTSVKLCILDPCRQKVIFTVSHKTTADVKSSIGALGFEQEPVRILDTLFKCLDEIPLSVQQCVKGVAITGQMHGIMLWNTDGVRCHQDPLLSKTLSKVKTSPLYTWMDQRCTPKFLTSLPRPQSHLRLATGHGNATLFWLTRNQGEITQAYDCVGTIMDYIVVQLCSLPKPVMTDQIAASLGYFNTEQRKWNQSILQDNGFPVHLLPDVVSPGEKAGHLSTCLGAIPINTPVYAALGDVQCAFRSAIVTPNDAVLNISTSIQIGFILKGDTLDEGSWLTSDSSTIEYFPYFNGDYIALSAGLNGGNVLQQFVTTLLAWTHDLGFHATEVEIWSKLFSLAEQCDKPTLIVNPTIYGERHAPSSKGQITALSADNTSLGEVFKATCHGIVDNLVSLMSVEFLQKIGSVKRILANGSAVQYNAIMRDRLEEVYSPINIEFTKRNDSALGAANIVHFCHA